MGMGSSLDLNTRRIMDRGLVDKWAGWRHTLEPIAFATELAAAGL